MPASALMGVGTQALFAAYRQVQTTANNIANANTVGYSRQQVELQTSGSESTGDGYIGRGVNVTSVTRATNSFLAQQTNALTSAAGADSARSDMLIQLEAVFGKTDSGLGFAATQIFNAYADLAAAPADLSARQAVLGKLDDFASLARATSARVEELQAQLQHDVQGGLAEVNGLARDLAKLNVQITDAEAGGHTPNGLLDQRDLLVTQIAQQVEVHTVTASDGSVSVFVASGESLVLGRNANQMVALPSVDDPTQLSMGVQVHDKTTLLSRAVVGEGRVAGLLQFQNIDLNNARARLGQLVSAVAATLNDQQARGLDLNGGPGSRLFNLPDPVVVPAATNAVDGAGAFVAGMAITLTNPAALQASDYRVVADAAGTFTVTRLVDGQARAGVALGDEVDGFTFAVSTGAPVAGESFVFKPVSTSAAKLDVALRNPLGLAAANPVTASAATTNVGTLAVSGVVINAAPAAPYGPLTVRFADDAGTYQIVDASNAVLDGGVYQAGEPITFDGMAFMLSGLPRTGDQLLVAPTVHVSGSNGNALTMQNFGEQWLVSGQSPAEAFAALLSDVGVRTQSAKAAAGNTATALTRATAQLSGETGVNLDEEAARLIQFQQSYQAAAKVLQTSQTMLDTVIGMVN